MTTATKVVKNDIKLGVLEALNEIHRLVNKGDINQANLYLSHLADDISSSMVTVIRSFEISPSRPGDCFSDKDLVARNID